MTWAAPNGVRLDSLDEELLGLMKETGLYLISVGVESGSDTYESLREAGHVAFLEKRFFRWVVLP